LGAMDSTPTVTSRSSSPSPEASSPPPPQAVSKRADAAAVAKPVISLFFIGSPGVSCSSCSLCGTGNSTRREDQSEIFDLYIHQLRSTIDHISKHWKGLVRKLLGPSQEILGMQKGLQRAHALPSAGPYVADLGLLRRRSGTGRLRLPLGVPRPRSRWSSW